MSRKYSTKLKSQNVDLFFLVTLTEKRNICNVNISSKHICLVGCEVGIKHYLGGRYSFSVKSKLVYLNIQPSSILKL